MKSFMSSKSAFSILAIVVIVVVIVAVAAAGAYYVLSQNAAPPSDSSNGPTPTTVPTTGGESVAGASSLKFSVSVTENGVTTGAYTFWGKNVGEDNFAMRIEYEDENGDGIFIFNAGTKQAWTYSNGEWTDISSYFDMQYDLWKNTWAGYVNGLAAWAGTGEYSYTAGSSTFRLYDISVNPALEDSLFTHSA